MARTVAVEAARAGLFGTTLLDAAFGSASGGRFEAAKTMLIGARRPRACFGTARPAIAGVRGTFRVITLEARFARRGAGAIRAHSAVIIRAAWPLSVSAARR
jgi:hypothetical protein